MSFIRFDPITNQAVIFAPKRGLRPSDFKVKNKAVLFNKKECPFCEGNEFMTPKEIDVFPERKPENSSGWEIRVVPNKFQAIDKKCKKTMTGKSIIGNEKCAYGNHEVIITKDHKKNLGNLDDSMIDKVVETYIHRVKKISEDKKIKYAQIIYNHGKSAGASLNHPHSQIFALDFIPSTIEEKNQFLKRYYAKNKKHLLEEILRYECKKKLRIIKETKDFVAYAPYASRSKFEIHIAPKRQGDSFLRINDSKRKEFAVLLRDVLKILSKKLGSIDYNFFFQISPCNTKKDFSKFHWNLMILPRMSIWAGFELGTNIIINSVLPEEAAKMLT